MTISRQYNAEFYDAFEWPLDDVKFYSQFIDKNSEVLELGCGTGRVSLPLSKKLKQIAGIEISSSMLEQAKIKCKDQNISIVHNDLPVGFAYFQHILI